MRSMVEGVLTPSPPQSASPTAPPAPRGSITYTFGRIGGLCATAVPPSPTPHRRRGDLRPALRPETMNQGGAPVDELGGRTA